MGACPLCHGNGAAAAHLAVRDFEHGLDTRSDFYACAACGLVFQDPQPMLSALLSYYPVDYRPHVSGARDGLLGYLKGVQAQRLVESYRRWMPVDKNVPILDLGCGSGQLLQALKHAGYRNLTGVDRNPRLVAHFEGTGIAFHGLELEPSFTLPRRYHTIILNYVIEHLLNPGQVLADCRKSLLEGGQILILTPNADSWCHRIFARYWSGLHAPRHPQIFSPGVLERLAQRQSFGLIEIQNVVDPASWAFSFQNFMRARAASPGLMRGTAWYSLAGLPFWYGPAVVEKVLGKSSTIAAALRN
jgi:SAM-dependent methyltransferase